LAADFIPDSRATSPGINIQGEAHLRDASPRRQNGEQCGATTAILSRLSLAELEDALRMAWSRVVTKKAN